MRSPALPRTTRTRYTGLTRSKNPQAANRHHHQRKTRLVPLDKLLLTLVSAWPSRSSATRVAAAGPRGACRSCPLAWPPAVPVRSPGHGCSGGSSPAGGPRPPPVTPSRRRARRPSPRLPITNAAAWWPAGVSGGLFPHGGEPVLRSPAGGVGRVHGDDGHAGVGGHVGEPVPESGSGDTRYLVSEGTSSASFRWPVSDAFAALVAGVVEVQVLDHDGGRVVLAGSVEDVADRGPEVPVSGVAGSPASGRPMVRGTPIWLPSGSSTATAR